MAERPVFIPAPDAPGFVIEKNFNIAWAGGFAAVQKKKNIKALHIAAQAGGVEPVLEASTKSDEKLGQRLSAFNLKVKTAEGELPLECVFQGSKVFERGGPYTDLYFTDPRSAKRDLRLQSSGKLVAFLFEGHRFPLEPKTVFYDWLYISAIFPHRVFLDRLNHYQGFTDIEFNPHKSINCQARACALFVSLKVNQLLEEAVQSPESFIAIVSQRKQSSGGKITAVSRFSKLDATGIKDELGQSPMASKSSVISDQDKKGVAVLRVTEKSLAQESLTQPQVADPSPPDSLNQQPLQASPKEAMALDSAPNGRAAVVVDKAERLQPSNFELFQREKAARVGQRSNWRGSRGTKKARKRAADMETLKLPPPSG